jgi:hypothetical protein
MFKFKTNIKDIRKVDNFALFSAKLELFELMFSPDLRLTFKF